MIKLAGLSVFVSPYFYRIEIEMPDMRQTIEEIVRAMEKDGMFFEVELFKGVMFYVADYDGRKITLLSR